MKTVAIIPARGGSRGIPEKNILELAGLPLIAYSIIAAKHSKYIERVIVTTDDQKISQISKEFGAEVIQRPAKLADDIIMPDASVVHAIEHLINHDNYRPDCIVFLQPTSPIRLFNDIDNAIDIFLEDQTYTVFSALNIHPLFWKKRESSFVPVNYDPQKRERRQDYDSLFIENGSIYISNASTYLEKKVRFGKKVKVYTMENYTLFEIDEPSDFKFLESLILTLNKLGINIVNG